MAKFRILLISNNRGFIDSFYERMNKDYIVFTCSTKEEDIENHIEKLTPDVFMIYADSTLENDYQKIMSFKRLLTKNEIVTGLAGEMNECVKFQTASMNMADMEIYEPIDMKKMAMSIGEHIEQREIMKMERELVTGINEHAEILDTRKKILVIDDDKLMLKVVKEQLQDDYDVAAAISGSAAFKYLESKKADLILLDYNMPAEDGPTILKKLHATPAYAKIPVIFLTGVTEKSKIAEVVALKPQGYLIKPIDKEKLLGSLDKFFAGK